jgi:PAS domain S-box-containing protein
LASGIARAGKSFKLFARRAAFLLLVLALALGLMNVVHISTYEKPTDGAQLVADGNRLRVQSTDFSQETILQVGDFLLAIDDEEPETIGEYEDLLYSLAPGSKHLYRIDRNGEILEPWVVIRGHRERTLPYFVYAATGFLYLLLLFVLWTQDTYPYPKGPLFLLAGLVFFAFAFHHTEQLSLLDWMSYHLDVVGRFLMPSALLGLALTRERALTEWRRYLQTLHWVPSACLVMVVLVFFPNAGGLDSLSSDEHYYRLLQESQKLMAGSTIMAAFALAAIAARSGEGVRFLYACGAWIPFALDQLRLEFPLAWAWSGILPALFPILVLLDLSAKGNLHIAQIGRKAIVYFCVLLVLFGTYVLFIRLFQGLLGGEIPPNGQLILAGFAIVLAALTYGPLRSAVEEGMDRLLYGERYEAMRSLMDLSQLNQAHTPMATFFDELLQKIRRAFGYENALALVATERPGYFRDHRTQKMVVEWQEAPEGVSESSGEFLAFHQLKGLNLADGVDSWLASDSLLWPLRVSGKVRCLLVLPGGPQDPSLNLEERQLLRGLLNQCEILLENMELYRSLELKAQSLVQLKEFNENIIESSKLGILATDDAERAVACNAAFCDLIACSREEVLGKSVQKLLLPIELHHQRSAGAGMAMEGIFSGGRNTGLLLDILKSPLKTRENEIFGTLYIVEDIREKKKFQDQLMQQEKLASIGLLAAGVAHEINTPLTGITSYGQMLDSSPGLSQEQGELVAGILQQSGRAAHIVAELLHFSRKEKGARMAVDLQAALGQTLSLLSHSLQRRNVEVLVVAPTLPTTILGFPNQIQQVFINLIVNAADAMEGGGTLTIRSDIQAQLIRMSFQDNGCGMDEETAQRIFDPFFTTKEVGKGTGLGLSVVYNILRDHGANIEVDSQRGQGTTMTLEFQRMNEETEESRKHHD